MVRFGGGLDVEMTPDLGEMDRGEEAREGRVVDLTWSDDTCMTKWLRGDVDANVITLPYEGKHY